MQYVASTVKNMASPKHNHPSDKYEITSKSSMELDDGSSDYNRSNPKSGMIPTGSIGTIKSMINPVFWYQKDADGGDKTAKLNLATCYRIGHGIEKDEKKAF